MKLRWAPGAALLAMWIGCGGAFTTTNEPGNDAGVGGPGGVSSTTGGAGLMGTGGGSGGASGSQGTGGDLQGSGGAQGGSAGTGMAGRAGSGGGGGGGVVDYTACDGPGQCMAVDTSCCGTCGLPELVNFIGLNTKYVQAYHQEKCPVALPCLACVAGHNPNIAAQCEAGHCKAFDVRKVPEWSSCQTSMDCHLRSGLGCCTCSGPDAGWVSVNATGQQAIPKAMCAPMTGCAACEPVPPPNTAASCNNHVCGISMGLPF